MINNQKTITIATLVRDRSFILPLFLEYLYKINYNKKLINILWVINNSSDNSLQILKEFKNKYSKEYNRIRIKELNKSNVIQDKRDVPTRIIGGIYTHLAELRNFVLDNSKKSDYLFSIDSDILAIDNEILNKLISHNKDIVSSLIYNGYMYKGGKKPYLYTNAMISVGKDQYRHLSNVHIKSIKQKEESLLQKVSLTGAVYLISKKVLNNNNIRYAFHRNGEDTPWCQSAIKEGYNMYCDLGCYSQHIMSYELLEKFKLGELKNNT